MLRITPRPLGFSLATWMLGIVLFIPSQARAVSFTLDASILDSDISGLILFDGVPGSLTLAPGSIITTKETLTGVDGSGDQTYPPMTRVAGTNRRTEASFQTLLTDSTPGCPCTLTYLLDLVIASSANNMVNVDFRETRQIIRPNFPLIIGVQSKFFVVPRTTLTPVPQAVPEPASILLLTTGLFGLAGYRWHQRRREGIQGG